MRMGNNIMISVSALPARYANNRQIQEGGLISLLAAQAIQAFESKGISTVEQRSIFRESMILELHGIGLSSIPKLRTPLR